MKKANGIVLSGTNSEIKRLIALMKHNVPKNILIKDIIQNCNTCECEHQTCHDLCNSHYDCVIPDNSKQKYNSNEFTNMLTSKFETINHRRTYMLKFFLL